MEGILSTRPAESSCYRCYFFERELRNKDETILELQNKLRQIHETSWDGNILHPQEGTKINITSVNLGLGVSLPSLRRTHCSDTDTGSDSSSVSVNDNNDIKQNPKAKYGIRNGSGEHKLNVTLQEIIDKVIDGSPKQKRLTRSTRYKGEDKFMESLLRKFNAAAESSGDIKMDLHQAEKVVNERRSPKMTKTRLSGSKIYKRSFYSASNNVVMNIQADQTLGDNRIRKKASTIDSSKCNNMRSEQTTETLEDFQKHLGMVKANSYMCPFCNKMFSRQFNLQHHIKLSHLNDDIGSKSCLTSRSRVNSSESNTPINLSLK